MPFLEDLPTAETLVSQIISVLAAYRRRSPSIPDRFPKFVPELQRQLALSVSKGEPVQFILPAFPFKAPVEGDKRKTLGSLPDKAEEIALQTLEGLACSVAEVYNAGAKIVIVSDASVYGDILNISDAESFAYYRQLRQLASSLGLEHLVFERAASLASNVSEIDSLEDYSRQLQKTRIILDEISVNEATREDENVKATSKYYDTALPKHQDQEGLKVLMLKRGKSYAQLIASKSNSIRLSIHDSNNLGKITLDLFPPGTNPSFITPWHGAVAVLADASVRVLDASTIDPARFDLITNANGQPWLLREKSDLFNWDMDLDFEPIYPCGMVVKPRQGCGPYRFEDVDMKLLRRLALAAAPLVLRGFTMEVEKSVFRAKAAELGEIMMWPFGDIVEIREDRTMNMNNVLTNEAMPFHYDGVFKMAQDPQTGEWNPTPPLFQMFRNRRADQQIGGLTLFASSRNLLPLLGPETISLSDLRQLKWKTFTAANPAFGGTELLLPFITPHPETGVDVFRFHEPWPASKCIGAQTEPTLVEVPGLSTQEGDALCEKLTRLLYDRRVALRHQWVEGDFVFNDNITTHHTRTAFMGGHREHWRVHVN